MDDAIRFAELSVNAPLLALIALLFLIIVTILTGFMREWIVPGRRAKRAENEAKEAYDRLKMMTQALPRITQLMESIDRRLDTHGFPESDRPKWRWPWQSDGGQ